MKKRSKYRPRRVLLDTMAFVQESLTPVAKHDNYLLDLKIVNSMAMASLMKGTATKRDMDVLVAMSNIVEVKARGAEVLAVAFKGNGKIVSLADDMIFVPKIDPLLCAVAEIVPLQLLAYYVAKENGCDIDKPKNLAKSVTVE